MEPRRNLCDPSAKQSITGEQPVRSAFYCITHQARFEEQLEPDTRLENPPNFSKFGKNRWNWAGLNLKTAEITIYYFKISEKIKISKIYVKN
jgi:hypothetical protein